MAREFPKISIVTPVYNNARFIESCILSVLDQEYPNLEYIVMDGGSDDGTAEIVKRYERHLHYWETCPDRGQTHALNKGFARATGDVRAWLNADEEYMPGTLLEVGAAFRDHTGLDFVYGGRIITDSEGREIGRRRWPPMHPRWHLLYRMTQLPTDASFWSARVHRMTGELDEERFPRLGMDADWLVRLSMHVRRWRRIPRYLSRFTERPDRATARGDSLDPGVLLRNDYISRQRIIERYGLSRARLFWGWLFSGVWCRICEGRLSFPHLLSSFRQMFFMET